MRWAVKIEVLDKKEERKGKKRKGEHGRAIGSIIIIIITVKKEESAMDTEGYSFLLHSFSGRFHLSFLCIVHLSICQGGS